MTGWSKLSTIPKEDPVDGVGDIWYINPKAVATGDMRIYGVLGLYCSSKSKVGVYIDRNLPDPITVFLEGCNVNIRATWRYPDVKSKRNVRSDKSVGTSNYGTAKTPGDIFKFQYDLMTERMNVPDQVRELKKLDVVVPKIREKLKLSEDQKSEDILLIHVKAKYYIVKNRNGQRVQGDSYHEEHKLSYTLALAVAKFASFAGWKVFINDDEGRLADSTVGRSDRALSKAKAILSAAGYPDNQVRNMMARPIRRFERTGTLLDQYKRIGAMGTTNVRHLGGRSGHLEFMIYLGQKVVYCEEKDAQGNKRIATTLATLKYGGEEIMTQLVITPTTHGGRLEMYADGRGPHPRRVEEGEIEEVDPAKIAALIDIVAALGLPQPA